MFGGWYTKVDDKALRLSFDRLILLLSPAGAASFLGTSVGPYLSKRAGERFANEGDDAVGGAWAPLKPGTVAIREEMGFPGEHPINVRTGELERWVVGSGWDAYPFGAGASLRYPGTAPTGTLKEKVVTAQRGRKDPDTVARPVLAVNEADMLFVIAALAAQIEAVF